MIRQAEALLERIRTIHEEIRDEVLVACQQSSLEQMSEIVAEEGGDTIFAIDRVSEEVLLRHFADLGQEWSFVLIAEGLGEDGIAVFPEGTEPEQAELRIIIDPIDGTRGIMYQKRAAWILTGVALNRGEATSLADIEIAVQTEIPLLKQYLSDSLWAIAGQGAEGERQDLISGECQTLPIRPSRAESIAQGYGGVARFFPGGRAELAEIEDKVIEQVLGPIQAGKVLAFEDQYISSGGQLYELMMGHDRWIADLRPLLSIHQRAGLCCHPYDLCTELIAREAGILVSDERGERLNAPLDVFTNMAWIGYANAAIARQVGPVLNGLLREHKLIDG